MPQTIRPLAMHAARCAAAAAALLPLGAASADGDRASEGAATAEERCLLRELKAAPPDATVGQLRLRCAPAPSAAAAPAEPEPALADRIERLLATDDAELSLFERRVASEVRSARETFALLPHRPNLLLPLSWRDAARSDDLARSGSVPQRVEAHFQISFKFPLTPPLFGGRVLPTFAYTGRSWWQLYDGPNSRPFREYNHEPELLFALPAAGTDVFGWKHRATALGLNHQSNGRSAPESRSWNRLTAEVLLDRGRHHWAALKVWRRLREEPKADPAASDGDDNPDITRYLGHFELKLGHASTASHALALTLRHNLRGRGRGAAQLDWSHPTRYSPELRWTARYFVGYGDSLIDYDVKLRSFGVGLMLNDWF